ncbi:glycosyltransferase [Paenarthrobacter nitroguajacolicus]|uniref:glycosyltransferase n=1 Tax=Paenarthrobacter nitroguajacolicus TaxID=211146 RepID=UPI003D7C1A20
MRSDVRVARTWYDPAVFYPPDDRPTDPRVVAWVGRLDDQKDPWLALDVARTMKARASTWKLQMIGDGPLRSSLEAVVSREDLGEYVTFSGALSRSEVGGHLRRASAFLMTSHYEGSPTVLVEALASGLPAVCTTGSDPDMVLQEGVCGIRVEDRTGDSLLSALDNVSHYEIQDCVQTVAERSARKSVEKLLNFSDLT